uniref:dynamin GTPase n=1 Tax=Blastobotrys adeninivorans TaxID=409370 RepID=A0A060SZB5_BLAAD
MASLEDLIPVVNKLQDLVFNTIGTDTLDLPQVVVVGSQSSGKSSVLENIVGKDFLPRGTGIVTRRPLILQLVNLPSEEAASGEGAEKRSLSGGSEWGEFLHLPNQKFYDFEAIREEIEKETSRIAGSNKGINRLPINLKIFSPHVLNITLVDLPGLTKIPIGDQPTDIEKQTRSLISEYIAKPNSIILAVSPANVDIVNSESLKLARQVDPQGKRTIGILTKLDLMDQGTNAMDILSGHVYPLKLGFIGVVNRSQYDIQENKSLDDALLAEKSFFNSHPAYKNIAHKCGTSYLAKTLNQTLMAHIRDRLPDIKARLNTLMGQTEQELASYGQDALNGVDNKGTLILQLMTKFASAFISSIEGTSSDISTKELCGGARIYFIYHNVFGQSLNKIDPTANLTVSDIRTAIRNSTGPRPSLFVPELAFDLLVKPQIKLLEAPSQRCVELVYEELMKIVHNCGWPELSRFPKLQTKLIEVISDLLRERLGPTSSYVSSLIDIQRAYINTNHPNFLGAAAAMQSIQEEQKQLKKQKIEVQSMLNELDDHAENDAPVNGHVNPEEETNGPKKPHHQHVNGHGHARTHSPAANPEANGENRDSFLNYFFGKENSPVSGTASPFPGGVSRAGHHHHTISQTHSKITPDVRDIMREDDTGRFSTMAKEMNEAMENDEDHLTEKEKLECELIRRLISSYFKIVCEIIQDQVPKAVMHLLVNHSKESAQNRLVSELYKESIFDELLYEDENLAQERKKCQNMLSMYKQASKIISEVI